MKNEFCTYEQALALKELGFDEPCFGYYQSTRLKLQLPITKSENQVQTYMRAQDCSAPLKQQVFKWFRDKHGLYHHIIPEFYRDGINFNWQILWYLPKEKWTKYVISDGTYLFGDNGEYPTQEQAEDACIDKLIELIKK